MVRSSVLIATVLTSCAVAQPTSPPIPPPIEPHAPQPAAARPDPPPGPAGTTCIYKYEPPSRAPPLITPTDGACHRSTPTLSRSLAAQIREQWRRHTRTGKLEIQDGCDRLGPDLVSLIVESKRSYGDPLTLTSLQRGADGHHDLVRIEYTESSVARIDQGLGQTDASETLVMYRAQLPDAMAAPLLARLRAAVHIEVQDHPPRPPQSGFGTGSTAHHFAVRIADDQGRGIQRSYQSWMLPGWPSWTLPLAISDLAIEEFLTDPAIRKRLIKVGADDAAARDLFSRVFWDLEARASTSHGEEKSFRRRLLKLAAQLAGAQHIPALLAWLGPSAFLVLDEDRERVIAAIAAITGHNRRHDARGRPRPLEQVAAEAFAACSRSPAADPSRL